MKYKVKRGIFIKQGVKEPVDSIVDMTEKEAKQFGNALVKIKPSKPKEVK